MQFISLIKKVYSQNLYKQKMKKQTMQLGLIFLAMIFIIVFLNKYFKKKLPMNTEGDPTTGLPEEINTTAFPLKLGSSGQEVKNLQMVLNQTRNTALAEDGSFGNATLTALQTHFGANEVSEVDYRANVLPYLDHNSLIYKIWKQWG